MRARQERRNFDALNGVRMPCRLACGMQLLLTMRACMRRCLGCDKRYVSAFSQASSCLSGTVLCRQRVVLSAWRVLCLLLLCQLLSSCGAMVHRGVPSAAVARDHLMEARRLLRDLPRQPNPELSTRVALHCASEAYLALGSDDVGRQREAEAIGNSCNGWLVDFLLSHEPARWTSETLSLG